LPNNNTLIPAISAKRYERFDKILNEYGTSIENFLSQSANVIISKIQSLKEDTDFDINTARVSLVGNLFKAYEILSQFQDSFNNHFKKFIDASTLKQIEREELENISILCFLYRQFIYTNAFLNGNISKLAFDRFKDTDQSFKKKIINGFKQISKPISSQITVNFDESEKRCIIIVDHNNAIKSFDLLEIVYNKLFDLMEQPDYTSIKYLIINSKYLVFNILLLVKGKAINLKWYEFKAFHLREKKIEELEQYNLVPQDIPLVIVEKYNITSWNKSLEEFKNLDKLLESASTAYQLAFHMSQLKYFKDRKVEDYNERILQNYINKTGDIFQKNLQTAIDLCVKYKEMCDNEEIHFSDANEKQEFSEFLTNNYRNFYPSEEMFEKGEFGSSIEIGEMEVWTPRLEKLTQSISYVYYFLADKAIICNYSSVMKNPLKSCQMNFLEDKNPQ